MIVPAVIKQTLSGKMLPITRLNLACADDSVFVGLHSDPLCAIHEGVVTCNLPPQTQRAAIAQVWTFLPGFLPASHV